MEEDKKPFISGEYLVELTRESFTKNQETSSFWWRVYNWVSSGLWSV